MTDTYRYEIRDSEANITTTVNVVRKANEKARPYWKAYKDICGRQDLTATDKLVLMVLGNLAEKTGLAWPGIDTLARMLGIGNATVDRSLKRLRKAGLVRVSNRRDDQGFWQSNTYELTGIPSKAHSAPPQIAPPQNEPLIDGQSDSLIKDRERIPDGPEADPPGNPNSTQGTERILPVRASNPPEPKASQPSNRFGTEMPRGEAKGHEVAVETHSAPPQTTAKRITGGTAVNVAPMETNPETVSVDDPVDLLMASAKAFLYPFARANGIEPYDMDKSDWDRAIAIRLVEKLQRHGFGLRDFETLYERYSSALKALFDLGYNTPEPRKLYSLTMLECLADGTFQLVWGNKLTIARTTFEKFLPRPATFMAHIPRIWVWDDQLQLNTTHRVNEPLEEWHQLPRGWKQPTLEDGTTAELPE